MGTIDSKDVLLLACGEAGRRHRGPDGLPTIALPARPGRADLDPLLAGRRPHRLIVAGTDADLAAVLLRLLRTDRLDVEVAFLAPRRSAAAAAWGLPAGRAGRALALTGAAAPAPLVRDDNGGVLVGRGEFRGLRGECYCDETLVLRGAAPWLVVTPGPDGVAVRAGRTRRAPRGEVRPVPRGARAGRGSAFGRAVQVGCEPATVVLDGVEHPRPVRRWAWYRHTSDWRLVRP